MMIKKNRILIVDDNPDNLSVLGNILMARDYVVQVSQDGASAIKTVHKKKPDLILLDINMPGMNGYDVCVSLKEDKKTAEIPIIFLTAHTDTESIVKGFSVGAVDYVAKPFNEDELLSRVKTHLDLSNARLELRKLNATKDKLFSIIAHDLRGPIGAMMTFIDLIAEGHDIEGENLQSIFKSQREITRNTYYLLDNLLNWAKQNLNQLHYKPGPLKINELLDENLQRINYIANNKNISLIPEYKGEHIVYADKDIVSLIIRNLLANAIKFTPQGGCVKVALKDEQNGVVTSITDSGQGISPDNVIKILSGADYLTTMGTNNEKGTGLGLKLVKGFLEDNNGSLQIESELNSGSCFSFTLPVQPIM